MCGISGIWRLNGMAISPNEIIAFNDTLKHRGPDGSGTYLSTNNSLALGHRRLSIIDLSEAGKQPMQDADGKLQITYNGEIYNFPELRRELKQKGHQFKTRTDTEVILAAYKEWGTACLNRFNGMWAFAIWDNEKQSLFAARDRFGVKPLYYCYKPNELFAFASETIAFAHVKGFDKLFDEATVSSCIIDSFYLEAEGQTLFKEIYKLKGGHYLLLQKNEPLRLVQWWNTGDNLIRPAANYKQQQQAFEELFLDACRIRLRSDVNIGLTLSGGLDSSSIYAAVQQLYSSHSNDEEIAPPKAPKAFIACFPGTGMNEQHYADQVIEYYHQTAEYIYPHNDDLPQQIQEEIKAEDFIYRTPPIAHTIYKAISQLGIKVSLDGHGADELLYGYPWMIRDMMMQSGGLDFLGYYNTYAQMRQNSTQEWVNNLREATQIAKGFWARNTKQQHFLQQLPIIKKHEVSYSSDPLQNIAYNCFHNSTLPTLLRNWDSASMRHGVEIRIPFLDYRLVCMLFSLPLESKIAHAFSKRILRDSMKDKLPESIRLRRYKIGINAPMVEWFNGPLNNFIADIINSRNFLQSPLWDGKKLAAHIHNINAGKKWQQRNCDLFWPYLNAYLLMH
jgi:asparagine synthase (glutamine-hydrolysing)